MMDLKSLHFNFILFVKLFSKSCGVLEQLFSLLTITMKEKLPVIIEKLVKELDTIAVCNNETLN